MIKNLKTRLKRLNICFDLFDCNEFKINHLNQFQALEQLNLGRIELKESVELNLQNLVIISIFEISELDYHSFEAIDNKVRLTIESSKLTVLFINSLDKIRLINYETVKHLHIGNCNTNQLISYIKIEYLQHDHLLNLNAKILLSLFNLKELHCNIKFELIDESNYNVVKHLMNDLLAERWSLKRLNLKIYFLSIQLNSQMINLNAEFRVEDLHIQNYQNLAIKLNWLTELNYSKLMNLTSNQLPPDLFDKYVNIQSVSANKISSQYHFIQFLANIKNLCKLELTNSHVRQEFYDTYLPYASKKLIELIIRERAFNSINFQFLINLKELYHFYTNLNIDLNSVLQLLIDRPNCLNLIYFKFKFLTFFIEKKENDHYDLVCIQNRSNCKSTFCKHDIDYDRLVNSCILLSEDGTLF